MSEELPDHEIGPIGKFIDCRSFDSDYSYYKRVLYRSTKPLEFFNFEVHLELTKQEILDPSLLCSSHDPLFLIEIRLIYSILKNLTKS